MRDSGEPETDGERRMKGREGNESLFSLMANNTKVLARASDHDLVGLRRENHESDVR